MKLTEAKLKQMILEAIKNQRFQDFGVESSDESVVMKQDLDSIMEAAGFDLDPDRKFMSGSLYHERYNYRSWFKGSELTTDSVNLKVTYKILNSNLAYDVTISTTRKPTVRRRRWNRNLQTDTIASGTIEIPPMFELSLKTEQGVRDADALMLSKEKQAIEQALEQYK